MRTHQEQMFDPKAFERPKDPGERDIDDWLESPNIQYHGTFRQDWEHAPSAHMGTQEAAVDRLTHVNSSLRNSPTMRDQYFDPSLGDDGNDDGELNWEPQEYIGRMHARRLEGETVPMHGTTGHRLPGSYGGDSLRVNVNSDANANAADVLHWSKTHEQWDIPRSVKESATVSGQGVAVGIGPHLNDWDDEPDTSRMTPESKAGAAALGEGKAVSYHNSVEGGTSLVVPRSMSKRTWEQDILSSPHASEGRKQFARQRREQGTEGTVAFDSATAPKLSIQGRLFQGAGLPIQGVPMPRSRINEFRFTADGYNNIT